MDFSVLPVSSPLDRLGQLLPIRTFLRLHTVVPLFQSISPVRRRFGMIVVCRESSGFLSITFHQPEDNGQPSSFTLHYNSPDDVLNNGPVECATLHLRHCDRLPADMIMCSGLVNVDVATPAALPFLACGAHCVTFRADPQSRPTVTLPTVISHLGPNVRSLRIPCNAFEEFANGTAFEPHQRLEAQLEYLEIYFPTFRKLIGWAQTNARSFIHQKFCLNAFLCCCYQETTDAEDEALNYCRRLCNEADRRRIRRTVDLGVVYIRYLIS